MTPAERKAAIAAFKEKKREGGVYAVRCAATDEAWVGRAPDLSTVWNRLSFTLARGAHPNGPLQAAWDAHGASGLAFERLETVDEDAPNRRDRLAKERTDHWRAALGAYAV